jgi:hypothetical protein
MRAAVQADQLAADVDLDHDQLAGSAGWTPHHLPYRLMAILP